MKKSILLIVILVVMSGCTVLTLEGCKTVEYRPYQQVTPFEVSPEDAFIAKNDVKELIMGNGVPYRSTGGVGDIYYSGKLIVIRNNMVYLK